MDVLDCYLLPNGKEGNIHVFLGTLMGGGILSDMSNHFDKDLILNW